MPRKLQACKECKKPCHGLRCSPCAHAQPGGTGFGYSHPSVNSVGEFNASGGFAGPAGIAFPKVEPTVGPWWIGLDRDELNRQAEAHARRMSRGICGNHRADNLGVINWNY
jgi:hypothetical protein